MTKRKSEIEVDREILNKAEREKEKLDQGKSERERLNTTD